MEGRGGGGGRRELKRMNFRSKSKSFKLDLNFISSDMIFILFYLRDKVGGNILTFLLAYVLYIIYVLCMQASVFQIQGFYKKD